MDVYELIDYWCKEAQDDLHCFPDDNAMESVKNIYYALAGQGNCIIYNLEDMKGCMVYCIIPDFRGGMTLNELFMYIKPEHRGSIRLFKKLVEHVEQVAKKNNCSSVRIASNIGYNDQKVLRVLKLWGYETDVVVKYL